MYRNQPQWVQKAEKKFGFIALPNLAIYLIVLQIFGILVTNFVSNGRVRLALIPEYVLREGEVWRLFTWMASPLASGFWILFALWFLYFVVQVLEQTWGEFTTTLYFLIPVVITIAFSLITGYAIYSFWEIELSLFLAVATLIPDYTIMLFLVVPVKMKWLGIFSAVMLVISALGGNWLTLLYLLLVFANYLLFFGPSAFNSMVAWFRRTNYNRRK